MPIPAPPALIDQVVRTLGLPSADAAMRARASVAVTFFTQCYGTDSATVIADHLMGIDFHWPVERVDLLPEMELVAYRYSPQNRIATFDPFGEYFTDVGWVKDRLGIPQADRRLIRYVVRNRTVSLRSRTATGYVPMSAAGRILVVGGGPQYVIPRASRCLRVAHIQNEIR